MDRVAELSLLFLACFSRRAFRAEPDSDLETHGATAITTKAIWLWLHPFVRRAWHHGYHAQALASGTTLPRKWGNPMTFGTPLFAGLIAAFALPLCCGCSTNRATVHHGDPYALIEDSVQRSFYIGMPESAAHDLLTREWNLAPVENDAGEHSVRRYELRPECESVLAPSRHRSYLEAYFDQASLSSMIYVNHWLMDSSPHGENEIHLTEARP
jgi:hypothetical protein